MKKILMAMIVACMGTLCAWGRTVCVTSQSATAVTFAFGAQDTFDYELFVGHGPTDAGEDKYGWANFERVTDVACDQTSFTWEVPPALRDGRFMRFFLMQSSRIGVAMAHELEWVKSTGEQYVLTGFNPSNRTVVDFRFGDVTYANATAFFGQNWTGSRYLLNQQSNSFFFHGKSGISFGGQPQPDTDYRVVVEDENHLLLYANGVLKADVTPTRDVASNSQLAIFGCNNGANLASFRFYRMKIAAIGTGSYIARDFVPALNHDGVAGLYDNMNNVFYPSKTATPLVAGPKRPAARFGRVASTTTSLRFRRTLAVTSLSATGATFAFGNPGTTRAKLCIAYGNTDGGSDKIAWTSFEELATIAGDQTTATVEFPAGLTPGMHYRFFLQQTDNLPYELELASITSTGSQAVTVGYIPSTATAADFRFGNVTYENGKAFFGQAWNSYSYLFNQQVNSSVGKFWFHSSGEIFEPVAGNTDYRVQILTGNVLLISHGQVATPYLLVTLSCNPICELSIFNNTVKNRGAKFRFDNLKLRDNGYLVRDLVPVVANGKCALFDRANGVVYPNLTATDFARSGADARGLGA